MKIELITGSRSDRNALVMVTDALNRAGHEASLVSVGPECESDPNSRAIRVAKEVRDWLGMGRPDLAIVHGDRHEILGAVMTLNMCHVPIAHIGGGDLTEGSQDDCFRHAITKLAHLHFASNQDSADRIIQMGEEPDRVHVTGCPGIDMVMSTPTGNREQTFRDVGLAQTPDKAILALFHPNTLGDTASEVKALSEALRERREALVLLGPNADAGSELIRVEWQKIAATRQNAVYADNVEPALFYSLMNWCDVMVGNSSAGFYEAPCFGIPVINVGDRQLGRSMPLNVETWASNVDSITTALNEAMGRCARGRVHGLYGDGHASERIAKVIAEIAKPKELLRKRFNDHCNWCPNP